MIYTNTWYWKHRHHMLMPQISQIILSSYKPFLSRISATSCIHLKLSDTQPHWIKYWSGAGFLACRKLNSSADTSKAMLIYCCYGSGIWCELWDNLIFPFLAALVNNLNTCLERTKNNTFSKFLVSWKVRNTGSESHKMLCSILKCLILIEMGFCLT